MNLRFHPVAWSVIIGTLLSRGVFFMVYPYLAFYLSDVQGLSPMTIGLILGVSSLVGTFSSFLGGVWSDRFGRFPVMAVSILLCALVFVGFGVAESAWAFFLLNACNGLCRNLFEPASRALLSDVTPKEQSLAVFSARYYAINLGAAVGPLIGLYFGSNASTTPFLITALVYALYGCWIMALKVRYRELFRQEKQEVVRLRQALKVIANDRFYRYYLLGNLFVCTAFSHLDSTLPQYLNHAFLNGAGLFSILLMTNAVTVVVLQIPITRLVRDLEPMTCVKIGAACFAGAVLGWGLFQGVVPLVLSVVLFTIGEVLCFVVGDVVTDRHAPAAMRGSYFGAGGLMFIGQSVGPWGGGMLLQVLGVQQGALIFAILSGLALLALPLYSWGDKSKSGHAVTAKTHT